MSIYYSGTSIGSITNTTTYNGYYNGNTNSLSNNIYIVDPKTTTYSSTFSGDPSTLEGSEASNHIYNPMTLGVVCLDCYSNNSDRFYPGKHLYVIEEDIDDAYWLSQVVS